MRTALPHRSRCRSTCRRRRRSHESATARGSRTRCTTCTSISGTASNAARCAGVFEESTTTVQPATACTPASTSARAVRRARWRLYVLSAARSAAPSPDGRTSRDAKRRRCAQKPCRVSRVDAERLPKPPKAASPTACQKAHCCSDVPQPHKRFSAKPLRQSNPNSPTAVQPGCWPSKRSSNVLPLRPIPPINSTVSRGVDGTSAGALMRGRTVAWDSRERSDRAAALVDRFQYTGQ